MISVKPKLLVRESNKNVRPLYVKSERDKKHFNEAKEDTLTVTFLVKSEMNPTHL